MGKFYFFLLTRRHDIAFQVCSQATAVTGHCYCGPTTISLIAWRVCCVSVSCTIRRTRSSEFVLGEYYLYSILFFAGGLTARRFRKRLISSGARTRDWWRTILSLWPELKKQRVTERKNSRLIRAVRTEATGSHAVWTHGCTRMTTTTTLLDWNVRWYAAAARASLGRQVRPMHLHRRRGGATLHRGGDFFFFCLRYDGRFEGTNVFRRIVSDAVHTPFFFFFLHHNTPVLDHFIIVIQRLITIDQKSISSGVSRGLSVTTRDLVRFFFYTFRYSTKCWPLGFTTWMFTDNNI